MCTHVCDTEGRRKREEREAGEKEDRVNNWLTDECVCWRARVPLLKNVTFAHESAPLPMSK